MLDGKVLGEDDTLLFENAGSGTATYAANKVNLSVTSGQYVVRQSKRFNPYFSGKSQLVECTFDNFQTQGYKMLPSLSRGYILLSTSLSITQLLCFDSKCDDKTGLFYLCLGCDTNRLYTSTRHGQQVN